MSFDFFNTSHLAFGSKLTKAFLQLDRLCSEAEENQENLELILQEYSQYVNRNYKAPFPTRPDAPCRTNELFDIINDLNAIKYIRLNEEGNLECAINLFKRVSNRFTVASGSTTLKEGYASVIDSISNAHPEREIQFTEEYPTTGNVLFQFRVDPEDNINIVGDSKSYFLPGTFNHIIGMEYDEDVLTDATTSNGKVYEASSYECIICIGYARWGTDRQYTDGSPDGSWSSLLINKNGNTIENVNGIQQRVYSVIYLNPGDKLSGNIKRAFRVKYTQNEVPIPSPAQPGVITAEAIMPHTCISMSNIEGNPESFIAGGTYRARCIEPGTNVNLGLTPIVNIYCTNWSSIRSITFTADAANQIGSIAPSHTPINAILHFNDSTTETISRLTNPSTINLSSYDNLDYIELESTSLGSLAAAGECYALYEDFSYELR